jgi:hypothetical protein
MLRTFFGLVLIGALGSAAAAQGLHDWQSLARLRTGDRVRLDLKAGPVDGAFQSWTPQQVTAGTVTAKREDVRRIERYRQGGWGRGQTIALGAAIGFGGGFAIGAVAAGHCGSGTFGPCLSRGEVGAVAGAGGLVVGALIGALLPRHKRELIYSAR